MSKRLVFSLGASPKPLSAQLLEQGYKVDDVGVFQDGLDAVSRLLTCGYIRPSTAHKCRDEVLDAVAKLAEPI